MFSPSKKASAAIGITLCLFSFAFAYSGGSGEPNDPYQISSVSDWNDLMSDPNDWSKHFIMTADVNLQGATLTPVGNSYNTFTGVFNGNSHIISNAVMNKPTSYGIGLFGCLNGGQICNLGIEDMNITGRYRVGGLVGDNWGGSITSCYATGVVTESIFSHGVGGLVGSNDEGTIINCYATGVVTGSIYSYDVGGLVGENYGAITNCHAVGTVSGRYNIGGLVGCNYEGDITNCYAAGIVSGRDDVGGLVGINVQSSDTGNTISNCYATGMVSGSKWNVGGLVGTNAGNINNCHAIKKVSGGEECIGGLAGYNYGVITASHATGIITGDDYLGGIAGYNDGTINNCYATGAVCGSYIGGLVGYNRGTITTCYSTGSVIGAWYVGGLVGENDGGTVTACFWDKQTSGDTSSDGGTGKTTAQMKTLSTFTSAGWDFTGETTNGTADIWQMWPDIADYPKLFWQSYPVTAYSGGNGTEAEPYKIATKQDLLCLSADIENYDKHFIMTADIDLAGITLNSAIIATTFPDSGGTQGTTFTGAFDGNCHIIRNIDINVPDDGYIGLFGYVGPSGQIHNLYVEDVKISGSRGGGLVGRNFGSISLCYVTGVITGNKNSTHNYVGGLVGNNYGTINGCYSAAAVTGSGSHSLVGGLVGWNAVVVTGPIYRGIITNCYATGAVSGVSYVGGLVGRNDGINPLIDFMGFIADCYSTGMVAGSSHVGGLIGSNSGFVGTSFWDIETSGITNSDGGTGKTTTEMKTLTTFTSAGWDFVGETANGTEDIWVICEGVNYPKFVWQNQPPIAEAGPDQTAYAWIDGIAEVDLDGFGSSDPDCNELTYYWSWVIDGNTYEANGVNPTIELPVGVHTIQLVVNDGLADSVPDDVNITVIAPLKGRLNIMPCVIKRDICDRHSRCHKPENILAFVRMPEGIIKKDINNEPLTLYPGEIEASRQWIVSIPCGFGRHKKWLTEIFAFFDKDDVLDAIPTNGRVELKVAGELTSGRCFYGSDTVIITGPKRPWHFPKK